LDTAQVKSARAVLRLWLASSHVWSKHFQSKPSIKTLPPGSAVIWLVMNTPTLYSETQQQTTPSIHIAVFRLLDYIGRSTKASIMSITWTHVFLVNI